MSWKRHCLSGAAWLWWRVGLSREWGSHDNCTLQPGSPITLNTLHYPPTLCRTVLAAAAVLFAPGETVDLESKAPWQCLRPSHAKTRQCHHLSLFVLYSYTSDLAHQMKYPITNLLMRWAGLGIAKITAVWSDPPSVPIICSLHNAGWTDLSAKQLLCFLGCWMFVTLIAHWEKSHQSMN